MLTLVAVPMPGQAVWPLSKPVVVIVQLPAVPSTVKPEGKVTTTWASVEAKLAVDGVAQTRPLVAVEVARRSRRTKVAVKFVAALTEEA